MNFAAWRALGAVAAAQKALDAIEAFADPALFISRVPPEEVLARAARLPAGPLHGLPFVVKDNIDCAGLPTTAACPDSAYTPAEDAPAVARLLAAGALLLGKVNLDQFATGLVGVRSPYGTPRNALLPDHIPGGSSSGSATAVAAGIAAFSLGSDTAGSGRIPAAAQELVGLKPSMGLVPTRGAVPACRSLDCISVFATGVGDAADVLAVMAGPDAADPYSRAAPAGWQAIGAPGAGRIAVPHAEQLVFDTGDDAARFDAAITSLEALGATLHRVDIAPLLDVAKRLYEGAWVAERTEAIRDRVENRPETLHPVTRAILTGGLTKLTVDAFADFHAAAQARLFARRIFDGADALLLPTHPGLPTLAELEAAPIAANARLGTYTNFVNLCDLSALAVPNGRRGDGVPCGITLVGPAFAEATLGGIAAAFLGETAATAQSLGLTDIPLFCIGAHMSGLPLNHQVLRHGGRLVGPGRTAPEYRLYDMGSRPGMLRVAQGGVAVLGEVWAIPAATLGAFLAEIPTPLGFTRVRLDDGTTPLGFIAEPAGVAGLPDISASGGWRKHLESK